MKIHREQIISTAIAILDRDGLEGVTLRRVAAELQVRPGALYWHVQNKQELLDEMANVLLSEQFAHFEGLIPGQEWSKWLQEMCLRLRQALLAHREGARVVAGAGFGRAFMLKQLLEITVSSLLAAGFSLRLAFLAWSTTTSYVYGFVIEEQAAPSEDTIRNAQRLQGESMVVAIQREKQEKMYTEDKDFCDGLEVIVDGIRQWRAKQLIYAEEDQEVREQYSTELDSGSREK
ncbi:TetR family transcriptional regulator [Ktedonosporobacter rubrisoli]|uniref:TetR family transcriptional regulator n=1 Tax=Ktedonosporobacter rubrisoli TaxID=2509675 RepID=A0A4P6JQT2_KTERU|nr:TetR/AcrR family transcriptional regulator C-terminal domain-containing protein [Ktedonosporobacter rubrisoli]QBD77126.1 TetR family transcriptional regulator [Ktedonosporobacter rubrisoli]